MYYNVTNKAGVVFATTRNVSEARQTALGLYRDTGMQTFLRCTKIKPAVYAVLTSKGYTP